MEASRSPEEARERRLAALALILLVPVPTLGTLAGMEWVPGPFGQALFMASKAWVLVLPLVWRLAVDREPLSWSPPKRGGFGVGALLGLIIGLLMLVGWATIGAARVDPEPLRVMAAEVGLADRRVYIAMALYWILINSLLEEYVWRWFVLSRFERLLGPIGAVTACAAAFTVHHVFAARVYLDLPMTVMASCGVFVGGLVWAECFRRYRSIWPAWASHVIADIAIFVIGWKLIFDH